MRRGPSFSAICHSIPRLGLGRHCMPVDPFYLTWKAREYGIVTRFIELAGEINTAIPRYVAERLALAFDQRFAKGLNRPRILIWALSTRRHRRRALEPGTDQSSASEGTRHPNPPITTHTCRRSLNRIGTIT
jgi:hypothetical protein